ncbi:MAG TPA: division/cell wall cluster transcriptional repressor MraZ [Desulfosalsimonadaceae bacterium]|nr:division/cell wall cluster transcriptional repressor MraZ [Desulfosalsimonadaceae bacterium]
MFRGSSHHTIDTKGRLIIPVRFREILQTKKEQALMVTRLDKALFAYPVDEWEKIEERIHSLAEKSEAMRRFRRVFIGAVQHCPVDRQGRILIPPELRNYARLQKEIVLVGVLDHFEIWSRQRWEEENLKLEEEDMQDEEVQSEIAKLGL